MQTEHPAVGLPASVLADAVRRRSFSGSVRGFDRNEVREYLAQVAAELEEINRRQDQLEAELREARGRASNPVLDEATITSALGQEAARILQSAHEAAADVRRRAEENAANVLREAHEAAERINAESETLLAARTTEAEAVAAGITEAASSEAEAVVARARAEAEAAVTDATGRAEAMITDADARCRAMVADAERARDQVLGELMRRRRVVYAQVEQLSAGRDALLAAVASVKALVGDAETALESAEADAKTAADAALRRSMNGPQPPVEDVIAEVEASAPVAEVIEPRRAQRSRRSQTAKRQEAAPPAEDLDDSADGAAEPEDSPAEEQPVPEAAAAELDEPSVRVIDEAPTPPPQNPAPTPAPADTRRAPRRAATVSHDPLPDDVSEGVRIIGPVSATNTPKAEVAEQPVASAEAPQAPTGESAQGGGTTTSTAPAAAEGATATRAPAKRTKKQSAAKTEVKQEPSADQAGVEATTSAPAEAAEEPPVGAAAEPTGEEGEPSTKAPGEPAAVDALFARLRADRVEATKRAEQVLADTAPEAEAGPETDTADESAAQRPGKAKRADAGAPATGVTAPDGGRVADESKDEDNDDAALARRAGLLDPVYDRLTRRLKRTLQDDQNDVLDRMRAGARTTDALLAAADAHAGRYAGVAADHLADARSAGVEYAAAEFGDATAPAPGDAGDAAARLAEDIVGPLRRRIDEAVAAAGSDEASLADAIGAAYRSLKGDRISQLAVDHATSAFSGGVLASLPAGTPVRWVVDDDGPCPDCDDNALAGATPAGEEFPTGQVHPPAHSGCRCLLAAAVS